MILSAPMVAIPMGLYRAVVRYLPERDIWTTLQAVRIATVFRLLVVVLTGMAGGVVPRLIPIELPAESDSDSARGPQAEQPTFKEVAA